MTQVLHIFRKDVRRLWLEISVSAVTLGLLTWTEWRLCTPEGIPRWYNLVLPFGLLFFSWWFIVARLIQDETLVGNRQFWVTRPYIWYKLLGAKALFIVVWIGVPLLVSQVALLLLDRAPVAANVGEILINTGGTLLVFILPAAALASITRSLSRWILCVVAVLFLAIGMAWLDSKIPNSHVPTGVEISDDLQAIVFAVLVVFGITRRYARRHAWAGTIAIAAGIIAVPLIMIATPYRTIIMARFPLAKSGQPALHLAFVPAEPPEQGGLDKASGRVVLPIPIAISSIPEAMIVRLDSRMLSIDLPGGGRWDSEWLPSYGPLPEEGQSVSLDVQIDRLVYERVKANPTPVRLSVALSEFADQQHQRIVVHQNFELPGVGPCWVEGGGFRCRSTASGPPLILLTVSMSENTCPALNTPNPGDEAEIARQLESNSSSGPLSPLSLRSFSLNVCPGTAILFSTPELVRRFRVELPLGLLRLNEYVHEPIAF
jgi:hypothetical protein